MCDQTEVQYLPNDVVWVKLGSLWWPGKVCDQGDVPKEILKELRKTPIAVVKFFQEDTYEYVKNLSNIYHYNCLRKNEFIKKGLDMVRSNNRSVPSNIKLFPEDVATAEVLIGGNPNIVHDETFIPEEKPDYKDLFATNGGKKVPKKVKLQPKKESSSTGKSPMNQKTITHPRFIRSSLGIATDYTAKVLEQIPSAAAVSADEQSTDNNTPTNNKYTCHVCNYTTSRLNLLIIHNKTHTASNRSPLTADSSTPTKKQPKVSSPRKVVPNTTFAQTLKRPSDSATLSPKKKKITAIAQEGAVIKRGRGRPRKRPVTEHPDSAPEDDSFQDELLQDWVEYESLDQDEVTESETAAKASTTSETKKLESRDKMSCFDFDDNEDSFSIDNAKYGRKFPTVVGGSGVSQDGSSTSSSGKPPTTAEVTPTENVEQTPAPYTGKKRGRKPKRKKLSSEGETSSASVNDTIEEEQNAPEVTKNDEVVQNKEDNKCDDEVLVADKITPGTPKRSKIPQDIGEKQPVKRRTRSVNIKNEIIETKTENQSDTPNSEKVKAATIDTEKSSKSEQIEITKNEMETDRVNSIAENSEMIIERKLEDEVTSSTSSEDKEKDGVSGVTSPKATAVISCDESQVSPSKKRIETEMNNHAGEVNTSLKNSRKGRIMESVSSVQNDAPSEVKQDSAIVKKDSESKSVTNSAVIDSIGDKSQKSADKSSIGGIPKKTEKVSDNSEKIGLFDDDEYDMKFKRLLEDTAVPELPQIPKPLSEGVRKQSTKKPDVLANDFDEDDIDFGQIEDTNSLKQDIDKIISHTEKDDDNRSLETVASGRAVREEPSSTQQSTSKPLESGLGQKTEANSGSARANNSESSVLSDSSISSSNGTIAVSTSAGISVTLPAKSIPQRCALPSGILRSEPVSQTKLAAARLAASASTNVIQSTPSTTKTGDHGKLLTSGVFPVQSSQQTLTSDKQIKLGKTLIGSSTKGSSSSQPSYITVTDPKTGKQTKYLLTPEQQRLLVTKGKFLSPVNQIKAASPSSQSGSSVIRRNVPIKQDRKPQSSVQPPTPRLPGVLKTDRCIVSTTKQSSSILTAAIPAKNTKVGNSPASTSSLIIRKPPPVPAPVTSSISSLLLEGSVSPSSSSSMASILQGGSQQIVDVKELVTSTDDDPLLLPVSSSTVTSAAAAAGNFVLLQQQDADERQTPTPQYIITSAVSDSSGLLAVQNDQPMLNESSIVLLTQNEYNSYLRANEAAGQPVIVKSDTGGGGGDDQQHDIFFNIDGSGIGSQTSVVCIDENNRNNVVVKEDILAKALENTDVLQAGDVYLSEGETSSDNILSQYLTSPIVPPPLKDTTDFATSPTFTQRTIMSTSETPSSSRSNSNQLIIINAGDDLPEASFSI